MDKHAVVRKDSSEEIHESLQASSERILESTTTYYNQAERRWCHGTITLQENALEFQESMPKKGSIDAYCITVPLSDISAIQRKNSSFIFGSIVIMSGNSAHWFSSFSNRDSVFNILNLFWQYRAFSSVGKEHKKCSKSTHGSTKLGKELLQLMHESEKTLTVAAENLDHQGEQLDYSAEEMDAIDSDLSVAEWLIGLMSPWKYIYRNQKSISHKKEEFEVVSRRLDHYCVVYCLDIEINNSPTWLSGMLEATTNGLKLYDTKLQIVANFSKHNVQTVQIISSWEMKIIFEQEDQKLASYKLKCPSLSNLKIVLNVQYGDKIQFLDIIPWKISCENQASSSSVTWSPPKTTGQNDTEIQKASLTDNEIEELNATIAQLKSLAVVVGLEQSSQMDKIEKLIQSVNKTDIRIKDDIKKIKKIN